MLSQELANVDPSETVPGKSQVNATRLSEEDRPIVSPKQMEQDAGTKVIQTPTLACWHQAVFPHVEEASNAELQEHCT